MLLQHCFAVKLQKCSVDYESSPDLPSTWGWGDNDWSSITWGDFSFKCDIWIVLPPQRNNTISKLIGLNCSVCICFKSMIYFTEIVIKSKRLQVTTYCKVIQPFGQVRFIRWIKRLPSCQKLVELSFIMILVEPFVSDLHLLQRSFAEWIILAIWLQDSIKDAVLGRDKGRVCPHISCYILTKQDASTLLTWNVGSHIPSLTSHLPLQKSNDTSTRRLIVHLFKAEMTTRSYNRLMILPCHRPACFSALLELGMVCLDWVGSGWVVEGNRQLEMGANVECEELGCVVGGPFKPNKLREVRGLVWRPWINKPSEMTMRCADICHHTAPASKHKPPRHCLPLSHVLSPTCPPLPPSIQPSIQSIHPSIPSSLHLLDSSFNFSFSSQHLRLSPLFLRLLAPLHSSSSSSPPPLRPISIPPFHVSPVTPSIHPFIRACMAGRPSGSSVCAIGRATELLWHSAVAQQPRRPGFRPAKFIYRGERLWDCSRLHFLPLLSQRISESGWVNRVQRYSTCTTFILLTV